MPTTNITRLRAVTLTAAIIAAAAGDDAGTTALPAGNATFLAAPPPFPCVMDALEKWSLEQALRFCGGKRMKAAAMLGMNYYTFRRRLQKHGIANE